MSQWPGGKNIVLVIGGKWNSAKKFLAGSSGYFVVLYKFERLEAFHCLASAALARKSWLVEIKLFSSLFWFPLLPTELLHHCTVEAAAAATARTQKAVAFNEHWHAFSTFTHSADIWLSTKTTWESQIIGLFSLFGWIKIWIVSYLVLSSVFR